MALLHPDVAVVLRNAGLRVQEGHADAALGTEASIVAATVFDSLPVELVAEPEHRQREQAGKRLKETRKHNKNACCDLFNSVHPSLSSAST